MGTIGQVNYKALNAQYRVLHSYQVEANLQMAQGQVVAVVSGSAVNQQQTYTVSGGTPTSGSTEVTAEGTTFSVLYNETAASLQTKLEAIYGSGNVTCTGGPFPGTPIVATFVGELAGLKQTAAVVGGTSFNAGTLGVAISRVNVPRYRLVPWNGARIADPTTAPTVAGTGSGGTFGTGDHTVAYTWVTAAGETLASPQAQVTLTSGQQIRLSAINAAGTPDDAIALNLYVDGMLAKQIAVATGAIAQTDVDFYDAALLRKPFPTINLAFTATDGRHVPAGYLNKLVSTNYKGEVFHATKAQGSVQMGGLLDADVVIGGIVNQADLVGFTGYEDLLLYLLGARKISGTVAGGDLTFAFQPFGGE